MSRPGLTHGEVLALTVSPARQLVRGLVERGTPGTIAGLPESHKSWLALQIATAVAGAGGRVLGRDVLEQGPVAYYWQDDSTENEVGRIKAYSGRHDLAGELPIRWHTNEGFTLPGDLDEIRAEVEDRGQVLAVFDSLYNFTAAGADLKDEAVSDVVKRVKAELCDPTGCTALLVDHAAWPTETNRSVRAYGSVFKSAAIRWGIYLKADGASIAYEARGNNIPRTKRTPLVWDDERLQLQVVEADLEQKGSAAAIAEWVRSRPGQTATPGDVLEHFDIARSTLRERRDELAARGVIYVGEGRAATYTAAPRLPGDSTDRQVSPGGDSDPAIPGATTYGSARSPGSGDSNGRHPSPGASLLDPDEHVRARLEDGGW